MSNSDPATHMATRHLAEFNIARIRYPLDDPRMAEFVDNVERVNKLAEQIEGFVWRLAGRERQRHEHAGL